MSFGGRRVYYLSPLRVWLAPGIMLLIGIFWIAVPSISDVPPATRNEPIYFGLFFLAFAVVLYFVVRRTRLSISNKGVTLHQFGCTLETDRENIAGLDDSDGAEGLVLHRPMECSGAYHLAAFRSMSVTNASLFSEHQRQLISERRLIPLNAFAHHLKGRRLRDDLATLADHN